MGDETMTIQQLASYLQRDQREVLKLASRGYLPGHRVSGEWRFVRVEINHWIETQMHAYTEQELSALEQGSARAANGEPLISVLLSPDSVAVPLPATTRASILRELVQLAANSGYVWDPEAVLDAVRTREELASTALLSGVAIPHPKRAMPSVLEESVIAFGRTVSGIPFGGANGGETDLFFLVCCRDDRTHLRVLARLSRLLLRPGFIDELRMAESASHTWRLIKAAEQDLLTL